MLVFHCHLSLLIAIFHCSLPSIIARIMISNRSYMTCLLFCHYWGIYETPITNFGYIGKIQWVPWNSIERSFTVAMVSEGYKLKIAFTTASKMTLCVFSCLGWSQIPQKNSEYPRTSAGYERGYGPRGRVSRRQDDSERRSNTKTKFPFLEKLSLQWYEIS